MKDLLRKLEAVYDLVVAKEADVSQRLAAVSNRESAVAVREQKAQEFESAEATLAAARSIQAANAIEAARITEDRVAFGNLMREERQALKNEEGRLAPLQDQERQLFVDRQTLYNREEAFKVEKRDFAARYIAKIKAHFANTGKEPAVDDIT